MNEPELTDRGVTGMTTYVAPNTPNLGVLRLDTQDGELRFFLMTKQIALDLSQSLAKLAQGIAEFQ